MEVIGRGRGGESGGRRGDPGPGKEEDEKDRGEDFGEVREERRDELDKDWAREGEEEEMRRID